MMTEQPITIQEKLQWLKENDKNPLKEKCKDQLKLRECLKSVLGKDFCAPALKIYKSSAYIEWDKLPKSFVIKCNLNDKSIFVKDKDSANRGKINKEVDSWLIDEQHKIVIEKYVVDKKELLKFGLWYFSGELKFYEVKEGDNGRYCNFYDTQNRFLKKFLVKGYVNDEMIQFQRPPHFGLMKEYGKKLSKPFKFVIINFYEGNGELFVDNFCFEPYGGDFSFERPDINRYVGDFLNLDLELKKKVIYTCITGEYETPYVQECEKQPNFDYICFTDSNIQSDFWEIRPLPRGLEGLSNVKKQRWIKINAHKILPEYEFSIWVDGNVKMGGNMNQFLSENITNKPYKFYVGTHPQRDDVYEEGKACIELKKDTPENIHRQLDIYKKEGLPSHYGMAQTCMLFRWHNNEECITLMEAWWDEMEKYGHRDQLSFPYALWKTGIKIGFLDKKIFKSEYFRRIPHNKK